MRKECPCCHKHNTFRTYHGLKREVWACKRCINPSFSFPYVEFYSEYEVKNYSR